MKRLILFLFGSLVLASTNAQFVHKIKADSVLITNDSCTAELNLENSTKHIKGFLYNKGNGRTEFRKAVMLNDSTLVFGEDTLMIKGSGGALSNGNGTTVAGTGSGQRVNLGGDLTELTILNATGNNNLIIEGNNTNDNLPLVNITSTSSGTALRAQSTSGYALYASSASRSIPIAQIFNGASGPGLNVYSAGGNALEAVSNYAGIGSSFAVGKDNFYYERIYGVGGGAINTIFTLTKSAPEPNAGFGGSIDLLLSTASQNQDAGKLVWRWTDAQDTSRTSAIDFYTANKTIFGIKSTLAGNGQWTWHGYPALVAQTDTTANKPLAIDGSGNVVKMAGWPTGSGGLADGDKGDVVVSGAGAGWNLEPYVPKVLTSGSVSNAAQMDILLTSAVLGGTFDRVEIQIEVRPATSGANLQMRFSTDGGSSFNAGASDYEFIANWRTATGSGNDVGANASAATLVNLCGNESSSGAKGTIAIHNYPDATQRTTYQGHLITHSSASQAIIMSEVGGQRKATQDTDAVRFFFNTGNITGNYRVIGYKNR